MSANGVYVVVGEANSVIALLNNARRQYQHSHESFASVEIDLLLKAFIVLKEALNKVSVLNHIAPTEFLYPFLETIKAQNTNGSITESALSAVGTFLSNGLIDVDNDQTSTAVESVSYTVVHTKFIDGKDRSSDECVLYQKLNVSRSLLLAPCGSLLSNESVCDLMQSCFHIVSKADVSYLLRKTAESTLCDMTKLVFTNLPIFREDSQSNIKIAQLSAINALEDGESDISNLLSPIRKRSSDIFDVSDASSRIAGHDAVAALADPQERCIKFSVDNLKPADIKEEEADDAGSKNDEDPRTKFSEEIPRSMSAPPNVTEIGTDYERTNIAHVPYGLPCCGELLRFFIALANPLDLHNTESMVALGLKLITVSLEASVDHLASCSFFIPLIRDNLCRTVLQLLDTEKLPIFAATNRVSFLLFESMRRQLKFQMEFYFHKLKSVILSEQRNISYDQREMAIEYIVQLWRIPGFVTEMYLNYDCDLYCSNLFENMTKLLVDMTFPGIGVRPAYERSLKALFVVVDDINRHCTRLQNGASTTELNSGSNLVLLAANRHAPSEEDCIIVKSEAHDRKQKKFIFTEGTNLFNQAPRKGIEFLQEKGLIGNEPSSVAAFLRTNPNLNKTKIAEYICSRKHAEVLEEFVKLFAFENTRLDEALRMFLETFRLPGEAAEVQMVLQHFSDQWYQANNEPFNDEDAAFTLSYSLIMLNMDQHNPQVRRHQKPMTAVCFKRNLSGTNNKENFDPDMLDEMFNAISSKEIVMPAEQTGLVKEEYLWKALLRRSETNESTFFHAPTGWNDRDLFSVTWGPSIAALRYVYDKADDERILKNVLNGYCTCASIAAHYNMNDVFDNLIIHLCKFSTSSRFGEGGSEGDINSQTIVAAMPMSPEKIAIAFGEDKKARKAISVLFSLVQNNGDLLRESWRNVLDVLVYLFRAHLLPPSMTEVDDFVDEKGWVSIARNQRRDSRSRRSETGLFSWLGLAGSATESHGQKATKQQEQLINSARNVIVECCPSFLTCKSKYLTDAALLEFLNAICSTTSGIVEQDPSVSESAIGSDNEDAVIFLLELMISTALENKDRLEKIWSTVSRHLEWLLSERFRGCDVLVERSVVGLLRVANRNLFRDVDSIVLRSLSLLLHLPPTVLLAYSRQIVFGLHELLTTNAANIKGKNEWGIIFQLMETAGAAIRPDDDQIAEERDSFSEEDDVHEMVTGTFPDNHSLGLNNLDQMDMANAPQGLCRDSITFGSIVLRTSLGRHEPAAFLKVCETMSFLICNSQKYLTADNLDSCVQCLRAMIEASLDGDGYVANTNHRLHYSLKLTRSVSLTKHLGKNVPSNNVNEDDDAKKESLSSSYVKASLHFLELCSGLIRDASGILSTNQQSMDITGNIMWNRYFRSLLQCIARLGCDCRCKIRDAAIQCLQRSLLPENTSKLGPVEWTSCFGEVFYPILTQLLEPFAPMDHIGMEDTRVQVIQIVVKTFLNHLSDLSSLPSFSLLWFTLLDFMEDYLRFENCESLNESVPESVKNMVLVLANTGLFEKIPGLHLLMTNKIGFPPEMIKDLFPSLKEKG